MTLTATGDYYREYEFGKITKRLDKMQKDITGIQKTLDHVDKTTGDLASH